MGQSESWRFIDSRKMSAAGNMAMDKVLLTSRSKNWSGNTLLFLEFAPCALVGYHQSVELEIEEAYCREHAIEINRRITGGGSGYMPEGALGWAVFAGKDTPGIPKDPNDMYARLCESVVAGLSRLGVDATFRPKNDIEVNGRKISGTGGTALDGAFLFHGSLLTDFDVDTMMQCLKHPISKHEGKDVLSFRRRVTSLRDAMGYAPDLAVVKKNLLDGFSKGLGVSFDAGNLNERELSLFDEEIVRFRSEAWIQGGRAPAQDGALKISDYEAPGGLIRASVLLDEKEKRIKSVWITGDFCAYPARVILDLEAFLRNSSSGDEDVYENVRLFFKTQSIRIPGVDADHMGEALCRAISRAAWTN